MTTERSAADIHGRDFPAGAVVLGEGAAGRRLLPKRRLEPEGNE
jgi:hypothetical protein